MTNDLTHTDADYRAYGPWEQFIRTASDHTMLRRGPLQSLITLSEDVLARGIPGAFVETGVWRGGAGFVMAEAIRRAGDDTRQVWMFDSFEGLPPPSNVDGTRAEQYLRDTDSPWYHDNCCADFDSVVATADQLGFAPRIVKGWFDTTLPTHAEAIGPIALLRIDCDWHDSVLVCLETLFDQVSPGGVVIIDDYFYYDGAAVAVHEFLGRRSAPFRIESVLSDGAGRAYNEGAFLRKIATPDQDRGQRVSTLARFTTRPTNPEHAVHDRTPASQFVGPRR
ncbi:TylF/MycF/NovP-related O-methyltransferase [Nocardia tengchongensis]|uniref:TylF/MycF/NovP-related O-methyltransferase n=1 Tax=Nocardia tengchongensis TaxID=2055889 RepID=UPI00367C4F84